MGAEQGQDAGQRRPQQDDLGSLLELIWEGKSLRAACEKLGLHVPSTSDWLNDDDKPGGRREQYVRAREGRAEYIAEDALTVNRAAALGLVVNGKKVDPSGARGYLEAAKWQTARMAPKTAPVDRHEHTGAGGGPIQYANMSREERQRRIAELAEKNRVPVDSGGD